MALNPRKISSFSITSIGEYRKKLVIWRYTHPAWAWLLSTPSLPSRQVPHGGQLLNDVFIYSKDITPSPGYLKGWRILKWLPSPLDQKSFQELVFKAFKNRKRSGCVDRRAGQIDWPKLFFFKVKLLIFKRWWQLWMGTTTIKRKYRMNLFVAVFRPFVLLPNLMSKLIYSRCTCKLII